jgi:hypothetical protein
MAFPLIPLLAVAAVAAVAAASKRSKSEESEAGQNVPESDIGCTGNECRFAWGSWENAESKLGKRYVSIKSDAFSFVTIGYAIRDTVEIFPDTMFLVAGYEHVRGQHFSEGAPQPGQTVIHVYDSVDKPIGDIVDRTYTVEGEDWDAFSEAFDKALWFIAGT